MATERGRQTDPDYVDLPRELDALCALPTREEEQAYLAKLIAESEERARRYAPVRGVGAKQKPGSRKALLRGFEEDKGIALLLRRTRPTECLETLETKEYDDILDAFGDVKRAALLGEPGAGKSTTLRKLAVVLARRAQTDAKAPVPVLAGLGNWKGEEPLWAYLEKEAPEIGWAAGALSRAGRLVLLLDGLNEVPTALWAKKAKELGGLIRLLEERTEVIVSCRAEDYPALDLGLDTLTLERLSRQRIQGALRQWVRNCGEPEAVADEIFWELAGDARLAGVYKKWRAAGATDEEFWTVSDPGEHGAAYNATDWDDDALWRKHVPNPRSLLKLAENPFLLTMLYFVRADEGRLPQNRGELFGRFIDQLLHREGLLEEQRQEGERLLAGLTELAWRSSGAAVGVLTVMGRAEAIAALGGEEVLRRALGSTLLEGGEEVRFRHQLLQEYFMARALRDRLGKEPAGRFWPAERWWERSGWEETVVLLAGIHAEDCSAVIEWLAETQPEVAAQCVEESGAPILDERGLRQKLQAAWMARLTTEPEVEGRAAVGRALGRLGLDARKGVGLTAAGVPDIDWVEIPGGAFVYQKGERETVKRFSMARYPVTNAQFAAFLQAEDGYREAKWWAGLDWPARSAAAGKWTEGNHPREKVNWFEAMAFCGWMGARLGYEVRLPTDLEWERAARGTDGRTYPWGEEYVSGYANINETWGNAGTRYLGRTSAVGVYPEGKSPDGVGVMDLSGNVWEWCMDEVDGHGKPKGVQREGRGRRVVRGGSWYGNADRARAAFRYSDEPGYRLSYVGFRVVSSSPIAGH
jgi:formylglycine-generating enzyme required for sulfatase activity